MSSFPEIVHGSDKPLYNIGVVSRMTGVSMATLRAWERRYGFPDSERTSGGHRLYSERDVLYIRWVKGRIDDGMQASHAINALHHQEETGGLALVEQVNGFQDSKPVPIRTGESKLRNYEGQLFNALIHRELSAADTILGEALAASSPENLILEVIGPVLSEIGEAWEQARISVATEHLATNYLRQRLLMWMVSGPPPKSINPIILACAPNEWHEGSLLILGALLRRRRWPVAYLGQSVPLTDLSSFIRDIRPSLVVLLAMTEKTAAELVDWPQYLPEILQSGRPLVGYGGRAFTIQPQWRLKMAGTFLGNTFTEGIETIENLLS